ncbi:MAG TPA: methyltransferase, TIGR04325 family [Desulfuromonadaceae bacterium]
MRSIQQQVLSEFIPSVVWRFYLRWIVQSGYFGNYSGWDKACSASTGYDSDLILQRVRDSLIKVKNGEAVYERDSVLFDEIQYSWPLLAGLLWIASCNGNRLNLLDFGGSLGSSYFQNRALLGHLDEFSWSVVEQKAFVLCGRELFEDQFLKFYFTIEECLEVRQPDSILLSSVLPYLKDPYELLAHIIKQKIAYVVIDRTPILDGVKDRLTVQHVPAEIYDARYPAWILGRDKLLKMFEKDYELVLNFDALAGSIFLGDKLAHDKGFIFRLKD